VVPAQVKAVVYPVAPLFDMDANAGAGALRPLCIKALKRIFHMCDRDKVGPRCQRVLPCCATCAACHDVLWRPGASLIGVAEYSKAMQLASRSCASCQRGWTRLPQGFASVRH
jgi:hypothetical protein